MGTLMEVNTPLDYKILQNNETKCHDAISFGKSIKSLCP